LGGEVDEGTVAGQPGWDAEAPESCGELWSTERTAGCPAGEQPWAGRGTRHGGASGATVDEVVDETVQRRWEADRVVAEAQVGVKCEVFVAGGQCAAGDEDRRSENGAGRRGR
jgi:hypothetical protein